jgi:mannose-6-phosphate isomerase-like protein (cupin superfamily)
MKGLSQMNNWDNMPNNYRLNSCPYCNDASMANFGWGNQPSGWCIPGTGIGSYIPLRDYGPAPFVVNIEEATKQNNNFRTALWTGCHLQLTLMSINVGGDIGLEMHPNVDQFIRIEQGQGIVKMGDSQYNLDFQCNVYSDFAFIIPAGKWHNLINTGNVPIKLYSIYAPPQHHFGTVHVTKPEENHC